VPHLPEDIRRARGFRDIVASKSGQCFLLGHGLNSSPPACATRPLRATHH
jgi:hypothetical protein